MYKPVLHRLWNQILAQRFLSFPEAVGSKRIHSFIELKPFNKKYFIERNKYIATKGQCSLTNHGLALLTIKTLDRASAIASFKTFRFHFKV